MPKLTIDSVEVEVPEGTNVLEAAKRAGVVIPHFCYHPALGPVGACRLCAMTFVEGPVKGVQVSCMVAAKDGMVVSTTDGDAARLRRMVIEWLMLNHPHDCPVCDEGGMCLLQDYTIAGGHGIRRYKGKKRTFTNQYLGEFIEQEMNRCIQCYRCSRFYQDYCGGTDFGPMRISDKVFFGRFRDGWLESEFSGNLAEVCPTGVFTDKTYRYKARPWDLETAPSVCPHCSLGCNTIPGARYRELIRMAARENQAVNGWFICDRGRSGYRFAGHADRPYHPKVNGGEVSRDAALSAAADALSGITGRYGPGSAAFIGSGRASLETNFVLKALAQAAGSDYVCFSTNPERAQKDRLAASSLRPGIRRSLKEVDGSDLIIGAGVDPLNEAPMLALMMRQAARKGARVVVLDPRPVRLPFKFKRVPTHPDRLAGGIEEALRDVGGSRKPTVVVGTDVGDPNLIETAAREAARLAASGVGCGLFYVMAEANSFGAALLSEGRHGLDYILSGIEDGRIKAVVSAASDPLGRCGDRGRAAAAFSRLETLIAIDCLGSETAREADVFLPCTASAEEDGVFVNQEGRAQAYARAYTAGIPINRMGPKPHPPRGFFSEVPGMPLPAWQWLQELGRLLDPGFDMPGCVADIRARMAQADPVWQPLVSLDPEGAGAVLHPDVPPPPLSAPREKGSGPFRLVAADLTFGSEELSRYSDKAQLRAPGPRVTINAEDAARLGLASGRRVEVTDGTHRMRCLLGTDAGVAAGVALAPRLFGFDADLLSGKDVEVAAVDDD